MDTSNVNGRAWLRHGKHGEPVNPLTPLPAVGAKERPHDPPVQMPSPPGVPAAPWLGRLVRGTIAVSALTLVLWWLVIPFAFPMTSRAVVNARTVQARSPIDGMNAEMTPDVGDAVLAGQPLLRVANLRVDTTHLAEVNGRVKGLEAQKARLERDLQATVADAPVLRATVKRYQKAVLACLASSVQEAKARTESARVELDASQQRQKRMSSLKRSNAVSGAELDDVQESIARSRKNLEKEQAVLTRLESELTAARQGVFLQNEASYSQKRADEADQKIIALKGSLKENEDLLVAARTHLREEQQRVERMAGVRVTSPVAGIVWKRPGNLGQVVKQNELIYEIADRKTIFIEALFHQRFLASSLVPGARAIVNLTSGERLCGRVGGVRTLGESGEEPSYAINLCSGDARQVKVLIALDEECQDAALIGHHVRVLVLGENTGAFGNAVAWLFSRVGG